MEDCLAEDYDACYVEGDMETKDMNLKRKTFQGLIWQEVWS